VRKRQRILHLIPALGIGGAQRTLATLMRIAGSENRMEETHDRKLPSLRWADLVVVHAWRKERGNPDLNVPPSLRDLREIPLIVFNHDWEGRYHGIADLVIVYSTLAARHWEGPQPVAVLPGGITLERFLKVANARNWSHVASVGRLSTLQTGKISKHTLAYWPQLPARRFLVGGAGPQLALLTAGCNDPRFHFVGEVRPRATHEFLAGVDIFLYDTDWHIESFCYVVVEALASGCVVVAGRRGAIPELIQNGHNGVLFDTPREAIESCARLLESPHLCRSLSTAGIATATRFTAAAMQARFSALAAEVLERRENETWCTQ
jgi:glycosyltransferase involved in cell wall biosynthesis